MFTKEEATVERVAAYLAACEHELAGNKAKKVHADSVGDAEKSSYWDTRIAAVKDEIDRVKSLAKSITSEDSSGQGSEVEKLGFWR